MNDVRREVSERPADVPQVNPTVVRPDQPPPPWQPGDRGHPSLIGLLVLEFPVPVPPDEPPPRCDRDSLAGAAGVRPGVGGPNRHLPAVRGDPHRKGAIVVYVVLPPGVRRLVG